MGLQLGRTCWNWGNWLWKPVVGFISPRCRNLKNQTPTSDLPFTFPSETALLRCDFYLILNQTLPALLMWTAEVHSILLNFSCLSYSELNCASEMPASLHSPQSCIKPLPMAKPRWDESVPGTPLGMAGKLDASWCEWVLVPGPAGWAKRKAQGPASLLGKCTLVRKLS